MNEPDELSIEMIVSGGQTGVDQGALDAAIALDMPHGGWCPRRRQCEAGTIPAQYNLRETEAREYWVRTEKNVVDSDGTLILYIGSLSGGTSLTHRMAQKHSRPCLTIDLADEPDPLAARCWATDHNIKRLNVAGPRESTSPGIADLAERYVRTMLIG